MKCLATLEALTDARPVIGRSKVGARTDARSMTTAMRIAKVRPYPPAAAPLRDPNADAALNPTLRAPHFSLRCLP